MPSTCQALEAILKSCDNNSGGIYGIWITPQDNIASITPTDPSAGLGWGITAITLTAPLVLFENFYIRRNTSSFTEEAAIDLINGSSFVTSTISLMFQRREADKSRAIKILGSGQQYLTAIVLDANGIYWYFPYLQVTGVAEGSGTARADGSKYAVTLLGENEYLAYEVQMTAGALALIGIS
jgi:hypothetical protein